GGWFNTKSGSDVGKSGQNRELVNSKVWEAKRWHHYKIVRNGDILQTFCDGRKIYERTVTSRFSGTGYLKFNSYATRIGIDNVKVTDASGSVQQTGGGSGIAGDGK
ncbi:MAG: hypothetical protein KKD56_05240, partial [Acidobacteria bacterium]|nr:hypothetical protein [Acidobacteriota bacterium]MBU1473559.1 hypothetical protein [Acidobacteriota bacterium]